MSVRRTNLLDILPNMAAWATDWNINITLLTALLRTFKITISTQGSHTVPSVIDIQLQDAVGVNKAETCYVRIRLANNNGYVNATNATMVVTTGTLVETLTASKDLIIKSNVSGLIQITVTDATIETFLVLLGSPTLQEILANFNNSQAVVHA